MLYESVYYGLCSFGDSISHHGVKGMKWGIRRYQNQDGSYTSLGRRRHALDYKVKKIEKRALRKRFGVMSKADHYARNDINQFLPKSAKDAEKAGWQKIIANAHQFTSKSITGNVKYVAPNGKFEAVYDKTGKLITNPLDMGSYNYSPSTKTILGHTKNDVLPWIMYGNAADDPSTRRQRVLAIAGLYTRKMRNLK